MTKSSSRVLSFTSIVVSFVSFFVFRATRCQGSSCQHLYSDWRRDTLGCMGVRNSMLDDSTIVRLKQCLESADSAEVVQVLGQPNQTNTRSGDHLYIYYVSAGPQCWSNYSGLSDSPRIIVTISSGAAKSIRIAYP